MFGFNLFQTSKLKVIPLSPYFYVCTHVNFTRVNKIEAIYGIPYEREPLLARYVWKAARKP